VPTTLAASEPISHVPSHTFFLLGRNLMEPVFMNGAEYGRYPASRPPEFARLELLVQDTDFLCVLCAVCV